MKKKHVSVIKKPSHKNHVIQFSIVIPTKNRAESVTRLVKQLLAQQYPARAIEIIVVDNMSGDQTHSLLRTIKSSRVNIVSESILGPSQCRNTGFVLAKFDHVIFLDDDIEVQPNFLTQYARAWHKHSRSSAIGCRILPKASTHTLTKEALQLLNTYKLFFAFQDYGNTHKQIKLNTFLISAALSVNKKNITLKDPLFNTALGRPYLTMYIFGEDFELSRRLVLSGHHIWYVPSIRVLHNLAPLRFTQNYIRARHILCGVDCFFEDVHLIKRFPRYLRLSKAYQAASTLKKLFLGQKTLYLRQLSDPMERIMLISYFVLGPLFFAYSVIEMTCMQLKRKLQLQSL
jgi:glycosyltransferase involved in cell wall biosynthesis